MYVADMTAVRYCNFYVDVVKSYQNFACSANIPGNRGNHEYALHLLQTCNGHIKVSHNMFYTLCPEKNVAVHDVKCTDTFFLGTQCILCEDCNFGISINYMYDLCKCFCLLTEKSDIIA